MERLWNYILSLFGLSRTPAQLFKEEMFEKTQVDSESLLKGAERQWRRLHDPDFQTKEMLEAIDRSVPKNKNQHIE